jgi:transposase
LVRIRSRETISSAFDNLSGGRGRIVGGVQIEEDLAVLADLKTRRSAGRTSFARRREAGCRDQARFVLVSENGDSAAAVIELVLGDGRRLRISRGVDEETLRTVLAVLEQTGVLSFPAAVKVYLCTVACDMRRSFDGLSMRAEYVIRCNPYAGHLLVFCNRRSDRPKILYWDQLGPRWLGNLVQAIRGRNVQFPFAETGRKEIAAWELGVLLEGR